jgi:hypothetical protein
MVDGNRERIGEDDRSPEPLVYRTPAAAPGRPATPVVVQTLAGVGTWVLGLAAMFTVMRYGSYFVFQVLWAAGVTKLFGIGRNGAYLGLIVAMLAALLGLSMWMGLKLGWRGFMPGVLLGLGLTCLVPVGIVAVVCGPWNR